MNKKRWLVFIIGVISLFSYGLSALDQNSDNPFWIRIHSPETNIDGIKLFGHMFYFWLFFIMGFFSVLFWAARNKNKEEN